MLNIVMLPWLGHGHVSPFLELAKKIGKRNHTIYLCSTKVILDSIKKRVNKIDHPFLHFIEIQLPHPPELPPHHHTTNGLPLHLNSTLVKAFKDSSPAFSTILETLKPDLVIYDLLQPWAPEVAKSHSIPAVMFHITSVATLCFSFHMNNRKEIEFPYAEIVPEDSYWLKRISEIKAKETSSSVVVVDEEMESNDFSYSRSSEIVLSKTFGEIDERYIEYTSSMIGKRVVSTGPLVKDGDMISDSGKDVMEWLDKKEKGSTVLVSFGSECYLSREEREAMAYGLEHSRVNFIWVIQYPLDEKISIEESLPDGFLSRVGDRGLVVDKWIPQARILAHENTGGFITHCGWSSVTEAIGFGVPIIAMGMQYDQPVNVRLLVNAGVGMEVYRTEDEGFNGPEIARVTREIVLEDKGKNIRKKVREMKEKFVMEGDDREIDILVQELIGLCRKGN